MNKFYTFLLFIGILATSCKKESVQKTTTPERAMIKYEMIVKDQTSYVIHYTDSTGNIVSENFGGIRGQRSLEL
jgi:hypothetical protein